MALARKCDICGGFYDWVNGDDIPNNMTLSRFGPNSSISDWSKKYDICPDCYTAINECMEMLKGGSDK